MKRSRWFEAEGHVGQWAFVLHRLSGLGLVLYLGLHLILLGQLRDGPMAWEAFLQVARSPVILALDGLLLGAVTFHGLNGLRLTLVGFGRGLNWQNQLFWVTLGLSIILTGGIGLAMLRR